MEKRVKDHTEEIECVSSGNMKDGCPEDVEAYRSTDIEDDRPEGIGYFPMFIDLWKKRIVVVGAGTIARRRIRTLLLFGADILITAPVTSEEAARLAESFEAKQVSVSFGRQESFIAEKNPKYENRGQVEILCKPYEAPVCAGAFMVLAATDDAELNAKIYRDAKAAGAYANNASDHQQCDFYFPSVVKQGDHVIGINGGGQDHEGTKRLRQRIQCMLDTE